MWFLFNGNAQSFNTRIVCNIEDLDDPIKDNALVCPHNDRSCLIEGHKGLQFFFQFPEIGGFTHQKDFISTIDIDDDGFLLVRRRFNIGLGKFDDDFGFPHRVEGVNQTESREEEDEDVEDDVGEGKGFQSDSELSTGFNFHRTPPSRVWDRRSRSSFP